MNRTENSNPKIRNYEINKISSSYFDDKIYILNSEYNGLPLDY